MVSSGFTVPTVQGCDPCDSTAVQFSVANAHILQRDCRLTWPSWWHFMSLQQCSHRQINKNSLSTESAEGIALIGLQGFTIQFYYLAKYNCLLLICPRERTYYLRYIFLFFLLCQTDCMCVSVCFCLYSILNIFCGYLPKKIIML